MSPVNMTMERTQVAPTEAAAPSNAATLKRAKGAIAGGDSSTMRVLPYHLPLVAARGAGARVWDIEGAEYIDLNMAFGPLLLGHRPPQVVEAVCRQVSEFGSQLGFPTEVTMRVAEKLRVLFPSMELMRFANSGTEACASAVRVARSYTGRRKLIMFEGHYHGWSEAVFNRYHAPLDALSDKGYGPAIPGTTGMTDAINDVIVCEWNDPDALTRCLEEHGADVAGLIMEPVMGNAGVQAPRPGFLQFAKDMCRRHGALLIFDEVISGMRCAPGGAQERYDVRPDITVISKALGGGYPVAAFGASAEIMDVIVRGQLFHGGVFSGNAVVMAAAEAVLDTVIAGRDALYGHMDGLADMLAAGFSEILTRRGIAHQVHHVGPLIGLMLTRESAPAIANYRHLRAHGEFERYIGLQHEMQRRGVYFHPNMFEPMFLSTAHTREDIAAVLDRFDQGARAWLEA